MAYSNIYMTLDNNYNNSTFKALRPNVLENYEFIKKARKTGKPVIGLYNSVAFPDNYKIESDIRLSCYNHNFQELFGSYRYPHNVNYDAVILVLKDLLVEVPVAVKKGFFQEVIKSCLINETHTISVSNGIITVSGKFKFNKQFLELDLEN